MINDSVELNAELIKQYEGLRLFAVDKQTTRRQQGYMWFVCKGMTSWLIEKFANEKAYAHPVRMEKNDLLPPHQPLIMQTITDILLKKINGRNQWSR